jgi:hypothetical protein
MRKFFCWMCQCWVRLVSHRGHRGHGGFVFIKKLCVRLVSHRGHRGHGGFVFIKKLCVLCALCVKKANYTEGSLFFKKKLRVLCALCVKPKLIQHQCALNGKNGGLWA